MQTGGWRLNRKQTSRLVLDVFVFPAPDILSKELQEYYLPSGKTLSQLHSLCEYKVRKLSALAAVVSFVTREHACGAEWPTALDIEICILDKAEAFSSEAMPTREVNRIFPRSVEVRAWALFAIGQHSVTRLKYG